LELTSVGHAKLFGEHQFVMVSLYAMARIRVIDMGARRHG